MKTRQVLAASLCLFTGTAVAQLPQNPLLFQNGANFASRGRLGTGPGNLSQALTHGQTANLQLLSRIQYTVQDQNGMTQSAWNVRLAGLAANGLPNYAAATTIAGPLVLPPSPGVAAYKVTHNLNTSTTPPLRFVPAGDQVHLCWQFLAGPAVGEMSLHMSNDPGTPLAPCSSYESPRIEAGRPTSEQLAWSDNPPGLPSPVALSWVLELGFVHPTLQGAALPYATLPTPCPADPGYAALDPDFNDLGPSTPARYDDYQWTVSGGAPFANGIAVLFHSQTVLPVPVTIPGLSGQLSLNPTDVLFLLSAARKLDGTGSATIRLGLATAPPALRAIAGSIPSWSSQALLIPVTGTPEFTQLWTMRPRTAPRGFTAARVVTGTPLRIAKLPAQTSVWVRNDGRGVLTVVLLMNNVVLSRTAVNERTMQEIVLRPNTTHIEFRGAKTNPTVFYYR